MMIGYGQMRHAEASSDTTIYTNKMLTFPDLTKKCDFSELFSRIAKP